jgi:hypothetical protein
MINAALLDLPADVRETSPKWADLFQGVVDRFRCHEGTKPLRADECFPNIDLPTS